MIVNNVETLTVVVIVMGQLHLVVYKKIFFFTKFNLVMAQDQKYGAPSKYQTYKQGLLILLTYHYTTWGALGIQE